MREHAQWAWWEVAQDKKITKNKPHSQFIGNFTHHGVVDYSQIIYFFNPTSHDIRMFISSIVEMLIPCSQ